MTLPNTQDVKPLDWFPKRFQPGDMDSIGGERLLGRTELSALEILVRETAQNSWDARRDDQRPAYGLHLRRADWRLRVDLDRLLPDGGSRVSESQLLDDPFILEIFDRGTTGLDGPVTLQPVDGDAPRNFQDLILKLGVPRDDGKGGGTYGFGKTASYAFSNRGTVVYWTRCINEFGELEHRLIASAFRESYVDHGVQYTGRHWWGRLEDDLILPVVGDEAEALGRRLFRRGFDGDETGTSMLILDPVLTGESLGSDVADDASSSLDTSAALAEFHSKARSALRKHLWPKMVPAPGESHSPMSITLEVDGQSRPLVDDSPGAFGLWGAGLNAIRAERAGNAKVTTPQGLPVSVHSVTRLGKTLGHLAIVHRIPALETQPEHDDLDPAHNASISRIALMRGQPELIVTTVDWISQSPLEGVDWLAVYKSADDWDAIYARAEPPAHDAWIASSGGDERLVVRATRNRVSAIVRDVLYPEPTPSAELEGQPIRTGSLARRFSALLPVAQLPTADTPSPKGSDRRRARFSTANHRVEASSPRLVATLNDGRQRQVIDFVVRADADRSIVRISVSAIGDEGVHEPTPANELDLIWEGGEGLPDGRALASPGRPMSVSFTGAGRRALRIDLSAEAPDGDR